MYKDDEEKPERGTITKMEKSALPCWFGSSTSNAENVHQRKNTVFLTINI
jgi:hypothetical protein